jgi:precorrin-6B methylase 2
MYRTKPLKRQRLRVPSAQARIAPRPFLSDVANEAFLGLTSKLRSAWPDLFVEDDEARRLRNLVKNYGNYAPDLIDYNAQAIAFNRAYLLKNLYKSLVSLSYLSNYRLNTIQSVYDIGSGAGVFSMAWASIVNNRARFFLIDRSHSQLELAQRIANEAGLNIATFVERDVSLTDIPAGNATIMSYWICEQNDDKVLEVVNYTLESHSHVLIIDYPDIIANFKEQLRCSSTLSRSRLHHWSLEIHPPASITNLLRETIIHVNGLYYEPK